MKRVVLFFLALPMAFCSCIEDQSPVPVLPVEMVTVEGGTVLLNGDSVTFGRFRIGKYEVTQKYWQDVMGSLPGEAPVDTLGAGDQYPVYNVSYIEVQVFLATLNEKSGNAYRLPTEAEWEYAAKGGQSSHNYDYSGSNDIAAVAWYKDNSEALGSSNPDYGTHEVGSKAPNELGIYDMTGNVREWCHDWYDVTYPSSATNPTGAAAGTYRVFRGGSWRGIATSCSVSYRSHAAPNYRSNSLGFRLALPLIE
ncbi:hypothetical protein SAMD00024442_3_75 [Candidatus Symbiothrix dinenymphae]|nr:hypothetical protein SAMD00024442_3_75 [Candidatus Symbiothrix dinenymphae]